MLHRIPMLPCVLKVEELLLGDPENSEREEMYSSLTEVIQLTQDLLKDAMEQQQAGTSGGAAAPTTSSGTKHSQRSR